MEFNRNTFANLALPLFAMAEPIPPKKFKHGDLEWSIWDRWIIEGDITMQELLDWFSARKLSAYSISCGQALLYNNIFPKHKVRVLYKVSIS
jgi:ubiquitin-activating enzyme E1